MSIIDDIKAVRAATGLGLGECKQLVHDSPKWEHARADHERFHAELEEAVRQADVDEQASQVVDHLGLDSGFANRYDNPFANRAESPEDA